VDDATRTAWRRHLGHEPDPAALRAELAAGTLAEAFAAVAAQRPGALALAIDGTAVTHGELDASAARVGGFLRCRGVEPGDRVLLCAPTSKALVVAYLGILRVGATAMPCDAALTAAELAHLLEDGEPAAAFVAPDARERLAEAGEVKTVVAMDALEALEGEAVISEPDPGPAMLAYTSGTTGAPKGALHAHRVLLGHLPGVEMSHDLLPQPGDRIWTPADWAWIGGLLDVLLPALHHGIPVVTRRFEKFTAEAAFDLMRDQRVRNAFIPPTALKMMRAVPDAEARWRLSMRSVASGGETLGAELLDWGRRVFGVTINEFYGQTECNMVVSSAGSLMPARPGIMGRAAPGHAVAIVDEDGVPCAPGTLGGIAVRRPDPVMFLGYWNNPAATAAKFRGDWLVTGDRGTQDAEGWLRFVGRDDDVITSSGYRIGPGEIEDCLIGHPAIQMAGVVGKPDAARTEIVKAYVVLVDGVEPSKALVADIQSYVARRLAAHEYPREVAFVDQLPMTTTGKVIRRELRERARAEVPGDDAPA
jgi:acetyl-CoA synthetase